MEFPLDEEAFYPEGPTVVKGALYWAEMPLHRVRRYDDPAVPLFQRFQVEAELDHIHSPTVRLRSGGYIVINQTEALVAIDVNSGRATRERHIEETAYKTNMEAAEEVAREDGVKTACDALEGRGRRRCLPRC